MKKYREKSKPRQKEKERKECGKMVGRISAEKKSQLNKEPNFEMFKVQRKSKKKFN